MFFIEIQIYFQFSFNSIMLMLTPLQMRSIGLLIQHTGGKWLIDDTKRRKDNQLQSLTLTYRIS